MKLIAMLAGVLAAAVVSTSSPTPGTDEGRSADRVFGGGRFHFDFDTGPGELILPRDIGV